MASLCSSLEAPGEKLSPCLSRLEPTMCVLSRVQLVAILWTVAHQPPPSMGFFRQEYWSGLPFPSAGDLPHSGIEPGSPGSPALQVGSLPAEPPGKPSSLEGPTFPGSWALLPSLQPAVLGRALFLGRLSASLSSVLPPFQCSQQWHRQVSLLPHFPGSGK